MALNKNYVDDIFGRRSNEGETQISKGFGKQPNPVAISARGFTEEVLNISTSGWTELVNTDIEVEEGRTILLFFTASYEKSVGGGFMALRAVEDGVLMTNSDRLHDSGVDTQIINLHHSKIADNSGKINFAIEAQSQGNSSDDFRECFLTVITL